MKMRIVNDLEKGDDCWLMIVRENYDWISDDNNWFRVLFLCGILIIKKEDLWFISVICIFEFWYICVWLFVFWGISIEIFNVFYG